MSQARTKTKFRIQDEQIESGIYLNDHSVFYGMFYCFQIGLKSVDLYLYWANCLIDKKNDTKEALRVFQLGLTACRENSVGMVKLQKLQKDIAAKTERKVSV